MGPGPIADAGVTENRVNQSRQCGSLAHSGACENLCFTVLEVYFLARCHGQSIDRIGVKKKV